MKAPEVFASVGSNPTPSAVVRRAEWGPWDETGADLGGALGPDSSRTLLTELARDEPHHDRVGAGSYRGGDQTVDGVQNLVWSSVGVAREPTPGRNGSGWAAGEMRGW